MSLGAGRDEVAEERKGSCRASGHGRADRASRRWFHQERDTVTRFSWSQGLRSTCQVGSRHQPGFRLVHQPLTPGLIWMRSPLAGQSVQGSVTSGLQVPWVLSSILCWVPGVRPVPSIMT